MGRESEAIARANASKQSSNNCKQHAIEASDKNNAFRGTVLTIRKRNYDWLNDFIVTFLEKYPWGNLDALDDAFRKQYPSRPTSF